VLPTFVVTVIHGHSTVNRETHQWNVYIEALNLLGNGGYMFLLTAI